MSGVGFTDHVITLNRGAEGFGFRIIGGQEEKTQVYIYHINPSTYYCLCLYLFMNVCVCEN